MIPAPETPGDPWRADPVAVVVPCYRSAETLGPLAERLAAALAGREWSLLLVDDASPDPATWEAIRALAARHGPRVRALRLARNVGQHAALGLGLAQLPPGARAVVTMDDDLQHRPEDVPALLGALEAGADTAIGAYGDKRHAAWRNLGGTLVDAALRRLFALPRGFPLTAFRALRRFVAEEAAEGRGAHVYLTASLLAASARIASVPVTHEPRRHGASGYGLARSLTLVANLLLTYSRAPFLAVAGLCLASLTVTAGVAAWVVLRVLLGGATVPGWASTVLIIAGQSSTMLAALLVLLLYVSRTHRLVSGVRAGPRVAERL